MKSKALLIKQSLEDFFYKIRVNIALRDVLKSDQYLSVAKMFASAIKKQLLMYTKKEVISDIVGLYIEKGIKVVDNPEIYDGVMRHWVYLLAILDQEEFNDYLIYASTKGGQAALDKLKTDKTFLLTAESSIDNIKSNVTQSILLIEQTTQLWLTKMIKDGLNENLSPEEIAKLIKSVVNRTATNRGDLIAEHEAALALGEMEIEVYRRSDVQLVRWITARRRIGL